MGIPWESLGISWELPQGPHALLEGTRDGLEIPGGVPCGHQERLGGPLKGFLRSLEVLPCCVPGSPTPPPPFHTNLTGLHVDACLPRMNTLPANARLDRTVDTHMLTRHPTLPPPHWKHGAAPETQSSSSRRRRATVPQSDNFRHARHSSWQESNPRTHTMSSRVQWGLSRPCTCTSASSHVRV